MNRDGFTETGGGGANLVVDGGDDTFFSVMPALEVGRDVTVTPNHTLRPYVRAGVVVYSDDEHDLTARFAAAPAGAGNFAISSEFDQVFADVEAGLILFAGAASGETPSKGPSKGGDAKPAKDRFGGFGESAIVSVGYEGRFSSDTEQHGGFVKVALPF